MKGPTIGLPKPDSPFDDMSTPYFSQRPRDTVHGHAPPLPPSSRSQSSRNSSNKPTTPNGQSFLSRPTEPRTPLTPVKDGRTASPNYFGMAVAAPGDCMSSSEFHARENWSPPSSQIRSAAAASPQVTTDQNVEFEAFRRQSEANRFSLGKFEVGKQNGTPANGQITKRSSLGEAAGVNARSPMSPKTIMPYSPNSNSHKIPEFKPRSPKRHLSSDHSVFTDRPRRDSPASFTELDRSAMQQEAQFLPRPSLPSTEKPLRLFDDKIRSDTLPAALGADANGGTPEMVTPQRVVNLIDASEDEVLILDLRVATHYASSHIMGALNLCIPTTLLKRNTFNIAKLADIFKDGEQRAKFERWRDCKYIIVYDNDTVKLKDASTCSHTLKKFANEGWRGSSFIISGGFRAFSSKFPSMVTSGFRSSQNSSTSSLALDDARPTVAPVVGGCPLPPTKSAANPFFANIRQNMDLIGGVGQIAIKHPNSLNTEMETSLPRWMRRAMEESNEGKLVSDKFLNIEKREQKRMQEALSGEVVYGSPNPEQTGSVQIAGIEKGAKNRYNNIWPFEHSRVKLQGVVKGGCDYVNANHVHSSWSNKRYIATQGPIPQTFSDFWNMVWQQDVRVIVMLTAEKEGGQIKAHNYWSDRNFGPIRLHYLSEHRASLEPAKIHRQKDRPGTLQRSKTNPVFAKQPPPPAKEPTSPRSEQPYVIVRRFTLSNSERPFERMREITQLQYSHWPDFGAPAHPTHLLGLIEQCDAVLRSAYGGSSTGEANPKPYPVVVHCSAGCGRTGTFCTVDTVIDILKRQRIEENSRRGTGMDIDPQSPRRDDLITGDTEKDCDLIEKTVEDFRRQRLSMVQSLRQFVLCYESVLEWLVEQQPRTA